MHIELLGYLIVYSCAIKLSLLRTRSYLCNYLTELSFWNVWDKSEDVIFCDTVVRQYIADAVG